ncbi:MAG: glycosyltransferase [Limnobacter sp.]|uniref:glycosyltransferase n=1 Tax=Limnobacter sp. TaxID=2003368 RepID=UPI0032EC4BC2
MNHSVFYISLSLDKGHYGGSIVAKGNLNALRSKSALRTIAFSVHRNPIDSAVKIPTTNNRLGTALANLLLMCATLGPTGFLQLLRVIKKEQPDLVWLDSSLFGILIPFIRLVSKRTKVVCFFHNIESDLVREYARDNPFYWISYLATKANEHLSAKYADKVVTIQKQDGERLKKKYSLESYSCISATINDINPSVENNMEGDFNEDLNVRYALFVGSDFAPNIEALKFLNNEIAPNLLRTKIIAVGNGIDKYRNEFTNVAIKGRVDQIAPFYRNALVIVAPLFSGGGMKVKIAEALMFNKGVIASTFGSIGYENVESPIIQVIDEPYEFAKRLDEYDLDLGQKPREYYLKYFSPKSAESSLGKIIDDLLT